MKRINELHVLTLTICARTVHAVKWECLRNEKEKVYAIFRTEAKIVFSWWLLSCAYNDVCFFYRFRLECFRAPEQTQPLVEVKTQANTKQKARRQQQQHTPTFYAVCNWKNCRLKKEIKKKLRKSNKRWNSPNELEKWTWIQEIEAEPLNDNNFVFGDVRLHVPTME